MMYILHKNEIGVYLQLFQRHIYVEFSHWQILIQFDSVWNFSLKDDHGEIVVKIVCTLYEITLKLASILLICCKMLRYVHGHLFIMVRYVKLKHLFAVVKYFSSPDVIFHNSFFLVSNAKESNSYEYMHFISYLFREYCKHLIVI